MIRIFLSGLFLLIFVSPAQAAWHEASSDHFLIYSNQKEKEVRAFSERLERYHDTMRLLFNRPTTKPSPSNRVTIYVVKNTGDVRDLHGGDNKYVGGFYIPRAGGSLAIVPKVKSSRHKMAQSELILLHEYAHHFLISSATRAYPRWLNEGFAEFYGTAKFGGDGSVSVGLSSKGRAYELAIAKDVPIELLLDTKAYAENKSKGYDSFYGQSWALYHMLHFSSDRKGQLSDYVTRLAEGDDEIEAAEGAFGDLKQLDKDLNSYLRQRKITTYHIKSNYLNIGAIDVRRLRAGEAAMMPVLIQSKRGVNEEQAAEIVVKARTIAAQHPNDPAVLAALAEAEYDAGNNIEAMAAADRALALNPKEINAHIQKGYALARIAPDAEDEAAAWKKMRRQFVKLNKIENDHPIPLIQFYRSYREQGMEPPTIAIDGLARALELAPYDNGLRWMMANEFMEQKKYDWAAHTLGPLAYSPHQSDMTERALTLLKEAEAKASEAKGKKETAIGS
ncbi:hypothetical protein [Parasphingorhabdus cellanae]|uniref:DUF1570 domain-containing protein n=1 Tax=Parasphingorhabdus cellanae TaxID=2806553 RepID=A0ABX7T259_9SPHN|nr:hypothetical protein [Parasphingorhabdus cellanae]QTD55038.1 hypothetical protein J4G78_12465 [Parasphingorhabdus cellanae]